MNIWTLAGFIFYLLSILVIGFLTFKSNKSHHDFFLGGRKVNPWVAALSERASGGSAWLLLGLPGAAFAFGLMEIWTAIGCVAGVVFYWYAIASKLRSESEKLDAITVPDFFAQKFSAKANLIRVTAILITLFFFTFYLAAQFNGAGKVLNVTFEIPNYWGIVIGTVFIVFYTMMGGFMAVAWTDFVQGIIMFGTLVVLPIVGVVVIYMQGGDMVQTVSEAPEAYRSLTAGKTGIFGFAVILSGLSWGLGYMGQPHLLARFMSINSVEQIKLGRKIAIWYSVPTYAGAIVMGLAGYTLYGAGAFEDIEWVMPQMANDLLPAWLAGIFISGAVAAMMSTADSQLLVITSSVIEDFYHKTLNKKVTEQRLLQLSRFITILVGLLGFFIAITSEKLIDQLVSYAWAGLGASFGPALLLALWWKKTSAGGVVAGMITGTISTVVWSNFTHLDDIISVRFMSFFLAFIAVVVVSLSNKDNKSLGAKAIKRSDNKKI